MSQKPIVTRFAPSPTGFMHVGGVRTALYAWLFARKHNGTFILRIEDTDKEREVDGSIEHIQASLQWLGLHWDKGPGTDSAESYIQSERLHLYHTYAKDLLQRGLAYADTRSEAEIEALKQADEAEGRVFLFRNHRPTNSDSKEWRQGEALRFKVPFAKTYTWQDAVWGELSFDEQAVDDFILIKQDDFPTYNFAHIVDDIEMEVTHVMRGQEFISSTPKFLSLYEALEKTPPVFATLPPILGPDGKKKLSKRDGAKDILEYKKEGYVPDSVINFLALLGWNPGTTQEIFTREELIQAFDIAMIGRSGSQLNPEKLLWIQKEHIHMLDAMSQQQYVQQAVPEIPHDILHLVTPVILERYYTTEHIQEAIQQKEFVFLWQEPVYDSTLLIWKNSSASVAKKHLSHIQTLIPTIDFSSIEEIKKSIFPYADEQGRGEVLWPLRVALSGAEKSPDPFTLLYILGQGTSLSRIHKAIEAL